MVEHKCLVAGSMSTIRTEPEKEVVLHFCVQKVLCPLCCYGVK